MKKIFLSVIIAIVVIVFSVFVWSTYFADEAPSNEPAMVTYTNDELGLAFQYRREPDGYLLEVPQRGAGEDPDFVKAVILMLKSDYEDLMRFPDGREGPPTMNVLVFKNPKKQKPQAWVDAHPGISNIQLKRTDPVEFSVAGAQAIRYGADGLYLSDNVVIAHGSYVYFVSGSYLDENSTIRRDFGPFLQSIQFIPEIGI